MNPVALTMLLQVSAKRLGYAVLSVARLKVMQQVITPAVFVPFSLFYLKEPFKLDHQWAGLCLPAAVYFMFRSRF